MPSSPEGNAAAAAVSDVVMPKLGLTMTEGVLAEWLVGPGDRVRAGQVMFIVETDKIANEVEAPADGKIVEILVTNGETVPVGTPLARWTGKGASEPQESAPEPERPATPADDARAEPRPSAAPVPAPTGRIRATPLARRMARQAGIELGHIAGSGPQGRIKAADIAAASAGAEPAAARAAPMPAAGERIAVSARHLSMARRVMAAKRDIPHFYLTARAEVSALLEFRQALNAAGGPKITLNHLLLKAVGRALLACPEANRIWADDALTALPASDVGMVVDTGEGLFIPILRDVGRQPLDALALSAADLIARAKAGGLRREDLEGGAVSVSNVGMAGGV
ncbi:MAG TPA: dihydrolipoamide acetyltransferase family protein, partial [Paracoccaceae bacterium]|nr:dihydrolipoamide acetyltransferase family protein [Paracoccaceae bacterium]